MKNGVVQGYLNPNDFSKYEDGTSAPITDMDYDVMIEFPRFSMAIETNSNNIITVTMSEEPDAFDPDVDGLDARAFGNKDKFYIGAYLGCDSNKRGGSTPETSTDSGKICSVSGVVPETNITLTAAIAKAQAKGSGYDIMGFYQWTYVQCLYLLKYGNLNSQAALGKGYVNGSAKQNTGVTNTQGMCYGNPNNNTDRVKLFGLEDAWGNLFQWLGGLYCDNSYNLLTKTSNFTVGTTASDYDYSTPSGLSAYVNGYMKQLQGTNGGGFIGKQTGGFSTAYWSDDGVIGAGYFAYMGGYWSYGSGAGLFYCRVLCDASNVRDYLGCRLMYL